MKKVIVSLLSMMFAVSAMARQQTISGIVTDAEDGEPLSGVTVVVPGTTIGTSTGVEGAYSITVPERYNTLAYSFVGYRTIEVEIDGRTDIAVALETDVQLLDDVVVVGYGTLPRRQITSSISRVTREDIADATLTTADQALQGRVSGVQFTGTSGILGAPSSIRIRGAASIGASTRPLVVIDGIPVTNPTTAGSAAVGLGMGGIGMNPLLNLSPHDIESYDVLKDAAASAIYGSRGSNGVILITTRQGRPDRHEININTYAGTAEPTNLYEMMNGEEFTTIWNDAVENRLGPAGALFRLSTDDIVNTDWLDLVTRTGYQQETHASLSGGTDRTRYFLSGTYRWEEGYVRNNELNRYALRLRLDHDVSESVSVGLTLNPTRTDNFRVYTENAVAAPITYGALIYPNIEPRNPDGTLNLEAGDNPFDLPFNGTPLSNLEGVDARSHLTQILGSAHLQWMLTRNLAYNTDVSLDLFQLQENRHNASFSTDGFPDGTTLSTNDQYRNINLTNTLEFRQTRGPHNLNAVAGITMQHSENNFFSTIARSLPDALRTINAAADVTGASGGETSFAFLGYLARVNYMLFDRYILTVSGRVDGSSRFGESERFGFFPSASAGWILSDEAWYADLAGPVDFLKLRASVGQTGNAEIGNFASLGLAGFGRNYNRVPGARVSQLPNPDLRWEKTTQYDAALEFGVFDSRLRGRVGYYLKDTDDLLQGVPVSRVNGFSSYAANIGTVRNQGWEFELTGDIFRGRLAWSSSVNLSTVKNEVLELIDGEDQIFGEHILREGEPLGAFYQVRYHGVNRENGNAQWLDAHGKVTEEYSLDNRVIAGNPFPDFFGGFTNRFAYRGLDLRIFFQYQVGNDLYRADGEFTDSNLNSIFNQSTRQNDYWTSDNRDAANPKPILFISNGSQPSTRYLEDGSYLRLKQLSLGYTLPVSLTGPGVNVRVFAQGENLLTYTDFNGMDPEAASGGNIQAGTVFFQVPQSRQLSLGVNLRF